MNILLLPEKPFVLISRVDSEDGDNFIIIVNKSGISRTKKLELASQLNEKEAIYYARKYNLQIKRMRIELDYFEIPKVEEFVVSGDIIERRNKMAEFLREFKTSGVRKLKPLSNNPLQLLYSDENIKVVEVTKTSKNDVIVHYRIDTEPKIYKKQFEEMSIIVKEAIYKIYKSESYES